MTWSERPFLPVSPREDVCMDQWVWMSASAGTQIIYMEEEIPEEVSIARLNYQGNRPT